MGTHSNEDSLKKFLSDLDGNGNEKDSNKKDAFESNIKSDSQTRASDLQFFNFDAKEFPLGSFYPEGTLIMIRPATVKEIQAYSMVDDSNFYDIVEKMNDMLSSCVRLKIQGEMKSYLELKDGDRFYAVFLIRELTFQKGNELAVKEKCECGKDLQISFRRGHFKFHEMDNKIKPFFDSHSKTFKFETKDNLTYEMAPPNIGIQKSFTDYIVSEFKEEKKPNMSFLKVIPFTLPHQNRITKEGINKKLNDYQNPDNVSIDAFQFLNSAVEKMKFGIEELVGKCECGLEVHTKFRFPGGASAIFVNADGFDKFIKS